MIEARNLQHRYVGTAHLLLGVLQAEGYATENVLLKQGLTTDAARSN